MNNKDFILKIYKENKRIIASIVKSQLYSGNSNDISDCIQDVWLNAIKNEYLQEHPNITGWLCLTAKIIVKQYNNKYLKEKNTRCDISEKDMISNDFTSQIIEDGLFDYAMNEDIIKQALKSLSDSERNFYILKYIKKLSNKEISEITGKSEGALNTRYSRIRKKIKKFIETLINSI